jgi:tetratricopeptide (TPR) repeat protein
VARLAEEWDTQHRRATVKVVIPEGLNPPVTLTLTLSAAKAPEEPAVRGTESAREAARRLASEGAAAYKAEDYAKALEKFGAAYRLYPAAPLLLNISRADLKLSRCAEALHFAEQFKAEVKDISLASPDSPDAWLADLQRACIDAEVDSTPPGATIWIDGQRQSSPEKTPWTGRLPVGKHKVLLWRPGYQKKGMFLKVDADAPAHLSLTLTPEGAAEAATAESTAETNPAAAPNPAPAPASASTVRLFPTPAPASHETELNPRAQKNPMLRNLGYVGIAVGGAALIVAIALGVTEQNQTAALGKTATSRSTAQSDAALTTTAAEAGGADALYVVGGVLAAAGIPLAVVF